MQRLLLLSALILLMASSHNGQSIKIKPSDDDVIAVKKNGLISDLQALETESTKLSEPSARALAKAEIADAAWKTDQLWARNLLREAYELTFPAEEEQAKLRDIPSGAAPTLPTSTDRAQREIRNRVLAIAKRDKVFADELTQLGAQHLGKFEAHSRYASLASKAIEAGDKETARSYILQSIEADPTQLGAGLKILEMAVKDRAAADQLTLQYIEQLRVYPLSMVNESAIRVHVILRQIVFPSLHANPQGGQIPQAGPAVIRAYVNYVIESISKLEQSEPGSAQQLRGFLSSTWPPLKQYAPELTPAFFELEKLSRRPGEAASLPQVSNKEANKINYEERVKKALDSDQPDELIISSAITREDFAKARKMIDKLADGAQKIQLIDMVNTREALSLAAKGDMFGAQRLAEQLVKATSILQVYPALINKCVAGKDQSCATVLVYQAIKQLKRADIALPVPPAGIPASAIPTGRELDPVLMSLSRLAKAVAPINETLALEVLDEMVQAANRSEVDTGQGRTGFETDVFKLLAAKNEMRARQAAEILKDPLRQIVALAAIYQWKAEELSKQPKAKP